MSGRRLDEIVTAGPFSQGDNDLNTFGMAGTAEDQPIWSGHNAPFGHPANQGRSQSTALPAARPLAAPHRAFSFHDAQGDHSALEFTDAGYHSFKAVVPTFFAVGPVPAQQ